MELKTLKCPACGAIANIKGDESIFTCDYCQNKISVIKPIAINNIIEGLNEIEQKKYTNFVTILNQAMSAGNYIEAYDYCNKALEINPNSAPIWENKAICTFWLSTLGNLEEKAGEIISYLNTSRQNDPNSQTYKGIAKSIAENFYHTIRYKYNSIQPTRQPNNTFAYSFDAEKEMVVCFRLFEMCYQIYPNIEYLKKAIDLMVQGTWVVGPTSKYNNSYIANRHQFDAARRIEVMVSKINKEKPVNGKPEYVVPKQKKNYKSLIIFLVICGIIILFMILSEAGKK